MSDEVMILKKEIEQHLKQTIGPIENKIEELLLEDTTQDFQEVILYQVASGGKRLRPVLTLLFCELANGNTEDALSSAAGIELIHNYSLLMDDIIDRSPYRRNRPTTFVKFGLPIALLAGMHYREAIFLSALKSPASETINKIFSDVVRQLVEGERKDVLFEQAGRDEEYILEKRYKTITLDDYFEMVGDKTAVLIKAACEVGVICANGSKEMIEAASSYGWNAGLAFQAKDDVLDLFADAEKLGKPVGHDIKEHKMGNIAVLYALEELESKQREYVLNVLRKEKVTDEEVNEVIDLIKSTKAPQKAEEKAKELKEEARKQLLNFPDSSAKKMLENIATYFVERTY
ncbi:polyprenyl synthetase family protein [Candidatus Borrarchaeum sp.]|uniref:polyprenyl synthetase family protein n=1 Tax=Candidatus Borrarchaeum sp. TaxID=2846742 RepID=UPI00257CF05D|nr:polyprenyl synthetase family protein [Candidatus Borrarchaeum sp.]